jgi:hypothetical protein
VLFVLASTTETRAICNRHTELIPYDNWASEHFFVTVNCKDSEEIVTVSSIYRRVTLTAGQEEEDIHIDRTTAAAAATTTTPHI